MEGSTGIASQSYATDTTLLAELRASWPPAGTDAPEGADDGYVATSLAGLEVAGAIRLTGGFAVALAADGPSFVVSPLARDEAGTWRSAVPGDGLSAFVAGVPMASERPVGVDQTHASVVVGERAIVKWFSRVGPGPSRAATLIAHLAALGFPGIPAPLGSLSWVSPTGVALVVAQGDAFLPDARDGWEWCVEQVSGDPSIGRTLGELVGALHAALATPSAVLPQPRESASPADVEGWRRAALARLDEAVALGATSDLGPIVPAMRRVLGAMPVDEPVALQPVHGDLHVGQILTWRGGLAVIDFDGNPALPDDANAIRQPRERDIAQLLSSLDHAGRIVDERSGRTRTADVEAWIAAARAGFLDVVGAVNEPLLAAFEVEQECRELLYAARFLPRWRYAPLATLRARVGRG